MASGLGSLAGAHAGRGSAPAAGRAARLRRRGDDHAGAWVCHHASCIVHPSCVILMHHASCIVHPSRIVHRVSAASAYQATATKMLRIVTFGIAVGGEVTRPTPCGLGELTYCGCVGG
jgi:hypothetical protein